MNPDLLLPSTKQPPKLLDQVRELALASGHPAQAAQAFVQWNRRFILFHDKRHPKEMGRAEIAQFLQHVVQTEKDPLPALEMSRQALEFLYGQVLQQELGELPRPRPPRLMDQVHQVMRLKHYARRTEETYTHWIKKFILFHGKRHPRDMGTAEVEAFLTHLAVEGRVSASTQNQALCALLFLYSQVLEIELGRLDALRARRGKRLPVVLSPEEVQKTLHVIIGADGMFQLMARLLYGCGLRLIECCRLRVKDVSFERGQIVVRCGKGDKDRVVMLPRSVRDDLVDRHI